MASLLDFLRSIFDPPSHVYHGPIEGTRAFQIMHG